MDMNIGLSFWIVFAIILFALGSIMALKPSGLDQRLDRLRMAARRLHLNPKLIAYPKWLKTKKNQEDTGMIAQYTLVFEDPQDPQKMPLVCYQVISGAWRPILDNLDKADQNSTKAKFALDQTPLDLPAGIAPFVKGLQAQANSIAIYWEDIAYVRPATNPDYQADKIEPDLQKLIENLQNWAKKIQNSA